MDQPSQKPAPDIAALRANPPLNMSLAEAAAYVGVSARKLWEEASRRRVRVARVGSRLIFKRADIDRWLELLAAQNA